jgi:hypothetical protein
MKITHGIWKNKTADNDKKTNDETKTMAKRKKKVTFWATRTYSKRVKVTFYAKRKKRRHR